jgi:hypothetical protein
MKGQHEKITPDRLIAAADAVLLAVAEIRSLIGNACIFPPDLMGLQEQPRCLCEFTRWEIEEATAFLVRMGALEIGN